jgi:sarcosine oxidase/L-pipecolate oxidase
MRYLLVGAGTFGASAALHLKQTHPDDEVILLDRTPFPCPSASGHDLNKIVRAEYDDTLYMELALEALQHWKSDPVLQQYYHETGILFAGIPEPGLKVVENFQQVAGRCPAKILEPSVAKEMFDGVFRDGDWTGVTSCTWNPEAGWADAEEALRSIIQKAVDIGVKYRTHSVAKVVFGNDGNCTGVQTISGETISADKVVLCTGANTAELLADSAPDRVDLQVGDRMVAAAAVMCLYRVPEGEMKKYTSAPVIVNPMGEMAGIWTPRLISPVPKLTGKQAESIPPGTKGLCKCTHELSFTNYTYHEPSKQKMSIPPKAVSRKTWSQDIPDGLRDETQAIAKKIYGSWIEGLVPETYRMCW